MRINIIEPYEVNRLKKLRVCAYVRVSTDSLDQADSLQNQSETYTRSITENPEYEFAGIYSDQGITGYSEKRPGFLSMMDDAMKGVKGCSNRSIDENTIKLACESAYNTILNPDYSTN